MKHFIRTTAFFALPLCASLIAAAPAIARVTPTDTVSSVPAELRPALYHALSQHGVENHAQLGRDGCTAVPGMALTGCFDRRGATFDSAGSAMTVRLKAFGRAHDLHATPRVAPTVRDDRIEYAHASVDEWWRALPQGFEHGFTIAKPPQGTGRIELRLSSNRAFEISGKDEASWNQLHYGGLAVSDANGRLIPSSMTRTDGAIQIAFDDRAAAYPISVDPLLWTEQKVAPQDSAANYSFGFAIALSGDIALIGAGGAGPGAVYAFANQNGTWVQTQKISPPDATAGAFGGSIGLSGTTALIGANASTAGANAYQGAAYIYALNDGTWQSVQEITSSDGQPSDFFGGSVALDGDTALIGANGATVNGNGSEGAAYVFTQSGGTWTQLQKLTSSDGGAYDSFGGMVILSGSTAFIGADYASISGNFATGAAYVFTQSGGVWSQAQKLTADDGQSMDMFGVPLTFQGTHALIAASNASGNGNASQGVVYAFENVGGVWTQAQKFTNSDGQAGDLFGSAVALNGNDAIIGAIQYFNNGPGEAYRFSWSNTQWVQQEKFTASDGVSLDNFGVSTVFNGANILIGASEATVNGNGYAGAAYFYTDRIFRDGFEGTNAVP